MTILGNGYETGGDFALWLAQSHSREEILELARESVKGRLTRHLRETVRQMLEETDTATLCEQVALNVEDYSFFPEFLDWQREHECEEDPYLTYGVMERDSVSVH